jgi:predicted nucleic acid-binding protein
VKPDEVPDGPLLVDTDVFSWVTWERARGSEFEALLQGHVLALSFATVGELRAGALIAGWGGDRWRRLEDRIARHYTILTATDPVTMRFAELYARLRGQLKDGGVNDMWTAACALAQPVPPPIVTGNLSDFRTIAAAFPLQLIHPDLEAAGPSS